MVSAPSLINFKYGPPKETDESSDLSAMSLMMSIKNNIIEGIKYFLIFENSAETGCLSVFWSRFYQILTKYISHSKKLMNMKWVSQLDDKIGAEIGKKYHFYQIRTTNITL